MVTILWPLYESATESPADASGCYCTVRPLYAGQGAPLSALAEQFRRAIVVSGRFTSSDNFRFARQNEAAGAADATAWVRSAVVVLTVR